MAHLLTGATHSERGNGSFYKYLKSKDAEKTSLARVIFFRKVISYAAAYAMPSKHVCDMGKKPYFKQIYFKAV